MANPSNNTNPIGNSMNSTVDKAKTALNSGLAASFDPATVDQLNHFKDVAVDKANVYYERSEKFVRQNPFYFIGGAALLGYIAGMMLFRKKD